MKCEAKIFISGDFCPAVGPTDKLLQEGAAKTVFGDLYEIIRNADLSITNLECPLTLSGSGIKKIGPNLKVRPKIASLLKSAGFGLVTLANNHIYDYGQQGLSETLDSLRRCGLSYVGAGLSLQEARKTFFIEIKDTKLAIVNFAEVEFSCANSEHGGANPMNLIDNIHQIQEARNNANHVLVIVHGGHENYHYPSPETLKRYRFYAESGAAAVIAHHTHCIGGYEQHKSVPVFYSLGNFFFPALCNNVPNCWYEGYALLLKITKDAVGFEILPYEQCRSGTFSIDRTKGKEIFRKIEDINRVLKNNEQITAKWEEFIRTKGLSYLAGLSGFGRYKTAILRRLGLLEYFYRKSQLNFVRQMIRCEAHKEATLEVLSNYLKRWKPL